GESLKPLGDGFIKIVKMIIAPVIFLTVVTGISGMSNMKAVGSVAGKAMLYFLTFSTIALFIGLIVANVIRPGSGLNIDPATLDSTKVASYVEKAHESSIVGFLMNIIPDTVISPLVNGNILQVLFIAIIFGLALAATGKHGEPIVKLLQNFSEPVFKMVAMLMKLAPIGAFGAMAFTIGKYGISSIGNLMMLIVTFYITSL
ncbi:cation:dicarboxylase symporter family transporter, partial [Providencia rettgeri]